MTPWSTCVRIGEEGEVFPNGSVIEDGLAKMPDLVANLKTQKGMRDQLINKVKKQKKPSLRFKSNLQPCLHQASIGVLNACSSAGVEK